MEHCSWKFSASELTSPRHLVLKFEKLDPAIDVVGQLRNAAQLQQSASSSTYCQASNHSLQGVLSPGVIHAFSLTDSSSLLTISFDVEIRKSHGERPLVLRALMPHPGFCSRDMLSFHGNCHAVSELKQNVTVAMSSIKGDAQLASFINMSQINDFIAANNDGLKVRPWQRPLDLSEPVRVGLFYNIIDWKILALVKRNGSYDLGTFENSGEVLDQISVVKGACGYVRVDKTSGRAVLEFDDCNSKLISLLSFPETADSPAIECTDDLIRDVVQLSRAYQVSLSSTRDPWQSTRLLVALGNSTGAPEGQTAQTTVCLEQLNGVCVNVTITMTSLCVAGIVLLVIILVNRIYLREGNHKICCWWRVNASREEVHVVEMDSTPSIRMGDQSTGSLLVASPVSSQQSVADSPLDDDTVGETNGRLWAGSESPIECSSSIEDIELKV